MRLRIQTIPPLPELKVWYTPDTVDAPSTVSDLKEAICTYVPPLNSLRIAGHHVMLLLDGFELLDASTIDIVRDGDLVCIKLLPPARLDLPLKREAVQEASDSSRAQKRRRVLVPGTVQPSSTLLNKEKKGLISDSSSSSDDSSDSSSSSSSSSSSLLSSSSSPTSSPPAPRRTQTTKALKHPPTSIPSRPKQLTVPTVPPGFGKPTTHSRNLRRRIKNKLDKQPQPLQPVSAPPKGSSSTNVLPLGGNGKSKTDHHDPSVVASNPFDPKTQDSAGTGPGPDTPGSPATEEQWINSHASGKVLMSTLRNKNKKKGFKQSMATLLPHKIVFTDPPANGLSPQNLNPNADDEVENVTSSISALASNQRLVTPSEKQEQGKLPPRMFVTSVDTEEGMWPERRSNKKRTRVVQEVDGDEDTYAYVNDDDINEPIAAPHAEDGVVNPDLDWDRAEKEWDQLTEVSHIGQLIVGDLVGWKALAINPQTSSPEVLLIVARITKLPDTNDTTKLSVRRLFRPEAVNNPFLSGGGFADTGPGEDEEDSYELDDILALKWREVSF